jgi:hypothetical protein
VFRAPPLSRSVTCDALNHSADFAAWLDAAGGAVAVDACSSVTLKANSSVSALPSAASCASPVCVQLPVLFTATDECGLKATSLAFYSVVDTSAPVFTRLPTNRTIDCSPAASAALTAWLSSFGGAQATDGCTAVTWTTRIISNSTVGVGRTCGQRVVALFTAVDRADNSAAVVASFEIVVRLLL